MRIYYWFKGVPEGRIGGPWWFRDMLEVDAPSFINVMKPFCKHIRTSKDTIAHHVMRIKPPLNAIEV